MKKSSMKGYERTKKIESFGQLSAEEGLDTEFYYDKLRFENERRLKEKNDLEEGEKPGLREMRSLDGNGQPSRGAKKKRTILEVQEGEMESPFKITLFQQ